MRLAYFFAMAVLLAAALSPAHGDQAADGRDLFVRRCGGCHALDTTKAGPALRGVFGRNAASLSGFEYSDGLRKARVVWDAQTLDRWLTDPEAVVPDTDMAFRLARPDERAAIIAYLKQLSATQGQH